MIDKNERPLQFAIIGCGLIGSKRLAALESGQFAVACDIDLARAELLARTNRRARATQSVTDTIDDPAVDVVIVSTRNNSFADITAAAISAGKPVLVEKPASVSVAQIDKLIALSRENQVPVRVGYNYRYHPALRKAHELVKARVIGRLMFLRGRYGHGGRLGYDKEWRADPKLAGGGELKRLL